MPPPGDLADIPIDLDGKVITIPGVLVSPAFSTMFDEMVDWCYDEARQSREQGSAAGITASRAQAFVHAIVARDRLDLTESEVDRVSDAVFSLATSMSELAIQNRNGIWAFILRNTYRPGLLAGQFNGLVSNPPWLALSQFANNPYGEALSLRATTYGIKPGGAAHLHTELATTHLLHAVDRYLSADAAVACLVPGTVLNAMNHQKLRDYNYLASDRPVAFELLEIWGVIPGTFKVRSAAMIGKKCNDVSDVRHDVPTGGIVSEAGVADSPLVLRRLGARTAWVLGDATSAPDVATTDIPPQGADIMSRPAVCITITNRAGNEWAVRTPGEDDEGFFAVKDAKKLKQVNFAGRIAPCFVHRLIQSLNLLPFILDEQYVQIGIPARRTDLGEWEIMTSSEIRTAGFLQTARRFDRIDRAMAAENVVRPLHEKIDERRKLTIQTFPPSQYIVVNGAGGAVACAAMFGVDSIPDAVLDQTLYWTVVPTVEEAWYRVGLMNSYALTQAIRQFNPEGELDAGDCRLVSHGRGCCALRHHRPAATPAGRVDQTAR